MDESRQLEVARASDTHRLVQAICDSVTNRLNTNNTEYFIQSIFCSCQLSKADRQKILNCYKSSKKKMNMAVKRKMSCAQLEPPNKKRCLNMCSQYYKNKDANILIDSAKQYQSMDANEEQNLLAKKTQAYQNMASCEKEKLFEKQTNLRSTAQHTKLLKCNVLDSCINSFQNKIKEGPYYICSVCNRILYRKTVIQLKKNKYSIQHLFTEKRSFDNIEYICKTCNSKLSKGQVPCQAVYNKLMVDEIPIELRCLQKLEQILIAQRIVFEKIIVMPKGQQRKIKGAICNVPVDCDQTCNVRYYYAKTEEKTCI